MEYEAYIICHQGVEEATIKELKLQGVSSSKIRIIGRGIIGFKESMERIIYLLHYLKTPLRMGILLGVIDDKEGIEERIRDIDFSVIGSFKARSMRVRYAHTHELEARIASVILEKLMERKIDLKVDLEDPDLEFFLYTTNKTIVGISLDGFNLDKRTYKLYSIGMDLKPSLASSLLMLTGIEKHETVLDPFCGSGVIIIEALSILNNLPVERPYDYIYEKMGIEKPDIKKSQTARYGKRVYAMDYIPAHLDITRKNSKIIGLDRLINFSRIDPFFLSFKLDQLRNISLIATHGPVMAMNKDRYKKIISMLIEEIKPFINKDFILGFIAPSIGIGNIFKSEIMKHMGRVREYTALSGKRHYNIYVYEGL